jgi:hypothetical protein
LTREELQIDGRRLTLGRFKTKEEAYDVYCEAAKRYYGDFARLV